MTSESVTVTLSRISRDDETGIVYLTFYLSTGSEGKENKAKKEKKLFAIPETVARDLSLSRGEVTRELYLKIEAESKKFGAYRRGVGILGYGANSKRTLERKLRERGFDRDTAAQAVESLEENGYIDEDTDAYREAERCIAKLYGERRIYETLRRKGYGAPYSESLTLLLEQTDFVESCAALIRKKYGKFPSERKDAEKAIGALSRYGYTLGQIKQALRRLEDDA